MVEQGHKVLYMDAGVQDLLDLPCCFQRLAAVDARCLPAPKPCLCPPARSLDADNIVRSKDVLSFFDPAWDVQGLSDWKGTELLSSGACAEWRLAGWPAGWLAGRQAGRAMGARVQHCALRDGWLTGRQAPA